MASTVSRDGLAAKQWVALWATRAFVLASVVIEALALSVVSRVMSGKSDREQVKFGLKAMGVAAFFAALAMGAYVQFLTLPDDGQKWTAGMGLLITS